MNKIELLNKKKYRLVYAFYIDNNSKTLNDHIAYKYHFKCLEDILYNQQISEKFSEIYFIIHTLDLNNHLIKEVIHKLSQITICCKNVNFIIEQNDPSQREGKIFKKYILDKLDSLDGLTLFFHNKGFNTQYYEFPAYWVIAQYYFNMFFDYEQFNEFVYNDNKLIFGYPWQTNNNSQTYFIAGSCFWIKCKEVDKYLKSTNYHISQQLYAGGCVTVYNCAENFFPALLDESHFDYPFSSIIKSHINSLPQYEYLQTTAKTYFDYTLPYIFGKKFFEYYDWVVKDIENYQI